MAPGLVFLLASIGHELGWWPVTVAYDLLAMKVAAGLSVVGGLAALALLFKGWRKTTPWKLAGPLAFIGLVTAGLFAAHLFAVARGDIENVTTHLEDAPGFGSLESQRGPGGPTTLVGTETCPGAVFLPTQVAPQSAAWALHQAGFDDIAAGVGRATGVRRGYWFGFTSDAIIRIRPGRTDIRVAARDGRSHGGEVCRLATKISESLREP